MEKKTETKTKTTPNLGKVTIRKESKIKSVYNILFSATPSEVAKGILQNVIIPSIKGTINDVWKRSGDMILWGVDSRKPVSRNGNARIRDYSSYSRDDRRAFQNETGVHYGSRADVWKDIGLDGHEKWDLIITAMQNQLIDYEAVTVAHLLEELNSMATNQKQIVPVEEIHWKWGWTNLDGADVEYNRRDGRWYAVLPKMERM